MYAQEKIVDFKKYFKKLFYIIILFILINIQKSNFCMSQKKIKFIGLIFSKIEIYFCNYGILKTR